MPRKSASASSVSAAAQAAAPVVSVVVETPAAPKVSRKPKAAAAVETAVAPAQPVVAKPAAKSASKSAAKPVAPAVEPVAVAVSDVAPVSPVVETVVSLQSKLADFGSKIQEIGTLHSSLKTEYKLLEKTIAREMKQIAKSSGHKRHAVDASGNKQLCGFAKPSQISDELIAFLGKEPGTTMSRVEVSKEISNYISANNLNNGRIIHADAKLAKLLKLNDGDDLNYFNLQRYMKHHFIKATPVVASA